MEPTDVDPHPLRQLQRWLEEARVAEEPLPDAMALATATPDGAPSVRMVMLRGLEGGPVQNTAVGIQLFRGVKRWFAAKYLPFNALG